MLLAVFAAASKLSRPLVDECVEGDFTVNAMSDGVSAPRQSKHVEVAFFDEFTRRGDCEVLSERGYRRILSEFEAYWKRVRLGELPGARAIDLGCGTGAFTSRLHARLPAVELHGMDISPASVERARQTQPGIQFHLGDIEASGLPEASFDAVFLSGVLHHFPDPSGVVAECGRILRPGGIALAFDPHLGNPLTWAYRCKKSPFYSAKGVTENEQPLSKESARHAFSIEPFSEVEVSAISAVTFRYVESRIARTLLPLYNFVDRMFDFPVWRDWLGSFLITYARKREGP
jgi:SAM-dependent methyltransferase